MVKALYEHKDSPSHYKWIWYTIPPPEKSEYAQARDTDTTQVLSMLVSIQQMFIMKSKHFLPTFVYQDGFCLHSSSVTFGPGGAVHIHIHWAFRQCLNLSYELICSAVV